MVNNNYMPLRKTPLVNEQIYHVYNRSVAQQPIFHNKHEYQSFLNCIDYYRFQNPPYRFSFFTRLNIKDKLTTLKNIYESYERLIDIYAFCIMPNHYHLLLKQLSDNGISNFIRLLQNSYAHYQNTKNKRFGALFQSPFKAVRVETDEQFIHVARYIHLNPLTSYILKEPHELNTFQWNSWKNYISSETESLINKELLLGLIKRKNLEKFTFDQLDYQRTLNKIKHLTFE